MFVRLVWRSIWGRRARLAFALLAVALGVTVAVALGTLSLQVGDELARALRAAGPNFVMVPAGLERDGEGEAPTAAIAGSTLPDDAVAALKRTFWCNNVLAAAPEMGANARVHEVSFRLVGTWFAHAVPLREGGVWETGVAALRPTWTVDGRWPAEGAVAEFALGADLARRLHVRRGDVVTVQLGAASAAWLVTAVVDAGGAENDWGWAPLDAVRAAGVGAGIERVWISALTVPPDRKPPPHPGRDPVAYERYMCTAYPEVVARELAGAVNGSEVLPAGDVVAAEGRVVGRLNFMMILLAVAAIAASALGVAATTFAAVAERHAEIGLLRALGARPHQVTALLLGETLAVSLGGGALGFLLGTGAAALVGGMGSIVHVAPKPMLFPAALLIATVIALVATWLPLRAARRVHPVEALRG